MRLLLDTNIICDFLGVNKGFSEAAEKIIQLSIDNEAIELVSASAMTDIYYVLRRETKDHPLNPQQLYARTFLCISLNLHQVLTVAS